MFSPDFWSPIDFLLTTSDVFAFILLFLLRENCEIDSGKKSPGIIFELMFNLIFFEKTDLV